MIFANREKREAIEIPYNWHAEYNDGKYKSEYDEKTKKKNDFHSIKKCDVSRFGLFGKGENYFFEYNDGSFILNGKRVDIKYELSNGECLPLTANFGKKDLITYKEAFADLTVKQGVQKSKIYSIDFGYKSELHVKGREIFFQPIVSIPQDGEIVMKLKMTSKEDLDGSIVFSMRSKEVARFEAPLKASRVGHLNWTIKEG